MAATEKPLGIIEQCKDAECLTEPEGLRNGLERREAGLLEALSSFSWGISFYFFSSRKLAVTHPRDRQQLSPTLQSLHLESSGMELKSPGPTSKFLRRGAHWPTFR